LIDWYVCSGYTGLVRTVPYVKFIRPRSRLQEPMNKVEDYYSRNLNLRSAITRIMKQNSEVCVWHGAFDYGGSNGVTAVFVT